MSKKLASYLVLLVAGALMIYSGARTFDLLSQTLPRGQEVLAFLALLAFDGGLIAWLAVFMFGAHGGAQRAIAMLMILVCLTGIVIGFGGDTLLTASKNGLIADVNIGMTALILTTLIIAANITATVFFHVLSPENQKRMAEENARAQIEDAALESIKSQAQQLAQEIAPTVASAWVADMRAHYLSQLSPAAQSQHLLTGGKPDDKATGLFKRETKVTDAPRTMASDAPEPIAVEAQPAAKRGRPAKKR